MGALFAFGAYQSVKSYREIMTQLTELQSLDTQINTVTEMAQKYLLSGDPEGCLEAWDTLNKNIGQLSISCSSPTLSLLLENLKDYQAHTHTDIQNLIQSAETARAAESYQEFLEHQEDRSFLTGHLLQHLTEQMDDEYNEIMTRNLASLVLQLLLLLGILVILFRLSWTFAQDIYEPVQKLTGQAKELMEGNYTMTDLPVVREDEMGQLTEAFNAMKNRVRENFQNQEELWRLNSMLQDAEYRALQSQVNPHFLFNVLSVATEAALLENADRTVDIIESVSYMLHYGLTSVREPSWLADELKMVRTYLFLQKERFGDRIEFVYDIQTEPVLQIPGMTLQPIVENAVKHGVERLVSGGRIAVSLEETPEAVILCVEDNGCGISPEDVAALNRGEAVKSESSSTGLGVANVRGRLQFFYQQPNLLRVESEQGRGTRVYLNYPKKGGNPYVFGSDR